MKDPCSVAVLISGNGTNLQALIDASEDANYRITAVISNNPDAYGLRRARDADIPTWTISHRDFNQRIEFDRALMARLDRIQPDLVVLAGFMRILSAEFVNHFSGRLLNIHPSLLPRYPGTDTHQRVLEAGDSEHGAAVHFVTEELDGGPVISQVVIPILPGDNRHALAARLSPMEHRLVVSTVEFFAGHRVECIDGSVQVGGGRLENPLLLRADDTFDQ